MLSASASAAFKSGSSAAPPTAAALPAVRRASSAARAAAREDVAFGWGGGGGGAAARGANGLVGWLWERERAVATLGGACEGRGRSRGVGCGMERPSRASAATVGER